MANQKIIALSGKVANIIFYDFRGKACSRIMPLKGATNKRHKTRGNSNSVMWGKEDGVSFFTGQQ